MITIEKQIKLVLVGVGDRANTYAQLALQKPNKVKIVGLVDPDPIRIQIAKEKYTVPEENCFSNIEEFLQRDMFANAVMNGTMDQLHVETSIPILQKGYDLLLEKPFCINEEEMWKLYGVARETGRKVMICHVLRYTPFYHAIKKHILGGDVGDIMSIEMSEHVSYHHFGVSYIRGKWANESECGSPLLLAKSCHDIDLMIWLKGGAKPSAVSSFGGDYQFTVARKPEHAGINCLTDCPPEVERNCIYSARKNYVEPRLRWQCHVCRSLEGGEITQETCLEDLKRADNPYGRCMWDCKHDIVDNQTVSIQFEDGTSGTFSLVGGGMKGQRKIHIVGTRGEIQGEFESGKYILRRINCEGILEQVEHDLNLQGSMDGEFGEHGGGDLRLMEDFVDWLAEDKTSICRTNLEDSMASHLTVFRAEKARKNRTIERVFLISRKGKSD